MRSQKRAESAWINNSNYRMGILIGVMFAMLFLSCNAHAADLLANTMGDVSDTLKGTGKKWITLIDFAVSLGAFAMTKKPFVFFSTLGVLLAISGIGILIA